MAGIINTVIRIDLAFSDLQLQVGEILSMKSCFFYFLTVVSLLK